MSIVYKKLITCLLGIGAISIHMTSFAVTSKQHPISSKKHKVTTTQVKAPAAKPITMPAAAMPKPKSVSVYDPKQVFVPRPVLPAVNIDGNIRLYDFDRHFSRSNTIDRYAFSLGGKVNLLTDLFLRDFRLGGTVYTAQPLGLNS